MLAQRIELRNHEAENLLAAWGAYLRAEVEREVGLPSESPSCRGYTAPPEWEPPPPGPIRPGDVERACWVMIVLMSRHKRLHRDLRDHYRDGCRLSYSRLTEGWHRFGGIWREWEDTQGPTNSL